MAFCGRCSAFGISLSLNHEMDEKFVNALTMAEQAGVRILAYDTIVTEDEIKIGEPVVVRL